MVCLRQCVKHISSVKKTMLIRNWIYYYYCAVGMAIHWFSGSKFVPVNYFCTFMALFGKELKLTILFSSIAGGYTSSFAPYWHWILSTLPFCLIYGQSATSHSNSAHWHPHSCLPVLQTHLQEQVQSKGTHPNGPWLVNKMPTILGTQQPILWMLELFVNDCTWFYTKKP
jgi:hypothetical protein